MKYVIEYLRYNHLIIKYKRFSELNISANGIAYLDKKDSSKEYVKKVTELI